MTPPTRREPVKDLSYGELLRLTEGHGTSEIYDRIQDALAAAVEAQQIAVWRKAAEIARRCYEKHEPTEDEAGCLAALSHEFDHEADKIAAIRAQGQGGGEHE